MAALVGTCGRAALASWGDQRSTGLAAMHVALGGVRLAPRPAAPLLARPAAGRASRALKQRSLGAAVVAMAAPTYEPAVCLVTGASQGIGACIARSLAAAGCKVAINYRDESCKADAESVAAEVAALGGEGFIVQADMGKLEEIEAMYGAVVEKWGTLEVLVNNAGITRDTLIMKMKPEQWQQVIDINLSAVFYNVQAALKIMGKKKKGRIVNIASVVGIVGNAGQANYSAAKGGVISMTKTVAREYAARGITANCVAPGFIATAMTAAIDPKYNEAILANIPMGRMGTPEEVAGAVRFLALDPAAKYITGQCIPIDGGMVM